jgi:hypothetical protein
MQRYSCPQLNALHPTCRGPRASWRSTRLFSASLTGASSCPGLGCVGGRDCRRALGGGGRAGSWLSTILGRAGPPGPRARRRRRSPLLRQPGPGWARLIRSGDDPAGAEGVGVAGVGVADGDWHACADGARGVRPRGPGTTQERVRRMFALVGAGVIAQGRGWSRRVISEQGQSVKNRVGRREQQMGRLCRHSS